ncbi:MAG TPA: hypothetical protein VGG03_07665 [Thermoanaerobaculia bacterium]
MRSFDDSSASQAPNAFTPVFLSRFGERDEPPMAGEADTAGPWFIEEVPGVGFGLFRAGESLARGFRPAAVFPDRWLALLATAVLPGTGRDPLLHLEKEPGTAGYDVVLDDGEAVGHFELFDEPLLDAINVAVGLVRSPWSLAYLLEAAGPVALERCGALLDQRVFESEVE